MAISPMDERQSGSPRFPYVSINGVRSTFPDASIYRSGGAARRNPTSLGLLSFFGTTTIFGTPVDVTLSELAIELFFPAD